METTLAQRIAIALDQAGMNQSQAGRAFGVTSQAVNKWLSGEHEPGIARLKVIAKRTGVNPVWLVFGDLQAIDGHATLASSSGGKSVAIIELRLVDGRLVKTATPRNAPCHFPCGPDSFGYTLHNNANSPEYPLGSMWILDPDLTPEPDDLVLVAYGTPPQPIAGRISFETTATGSVTIVTPLNKSWPAARSDQGAVEMMGVSVEGTRQHRKS